MRQSASRREVFELPATTAALPDTKSAVELSSSAVTKFAISAEVALFKRIGRVLRPSALAARNRNHRNQSAVRDAGHAPTKLRWTPILIV